MKMYLRKICWLLLLLLTACATPPGEAPIETVGEQVPLLPGAMVSADGLQISYPDNTLFAEGSVLPLPGGMSVLDPLIDFLMTNRDFTVAGIVRSAGHDPDYDRLLAGKRRDILGAIFQNRGIEEQRLQLVTATGSGPPLELTLQLPGSSSSSGEK